MQLSKKYSLDNMNNFIQNKDSIQLADLVIERFRERYIHPFEFKDPQYTDDYKNGFAIVACQCLLIEAILLYENGWKQMQGNACNNYDLFFDTHSKYLQELKGIDFYHNIRCGILHQGETKNGWTIRRDCSQLVNGKIIDANFFLRQMNSLLTDMKDELIKTPIESKKWKNIIKKLMMTT